MDAPPELEARRTFLFDQTKETLAVERRQEGTPMLRVHVEEVADAELATTLDELVAEGARRMLAAALEAEVDAYVSAFTEERRRARASPGGAQRARRCPGRW